MKLALTCMVLLAAALTSDGQFRGQFRGFRGFLNDFQRGATNVFRPVQHMAHMTQHFGQSFMRPVFSQFRRPRFPFVGSQSTEENDNNHGGSVVQKSRFLPEKTRLFQQIAAAMPRKTPDCCAFRTENFAKRVRR